jgi:hypothetical protein
MFHQIKINDFLKGQKIAQASKSLKSKNFTVKNPRYRLLFGDKSFLI